MCVASKTALNVI